MQFSERYKKYCKIKGISPSSQFAADNLGCTKQNIATILRTNNVPSASIVVNAAKMLDVSTDYLLGLTDIPTQSNNELTEEEFEIISDIKNLNKEGQLAAKSMIQGLLNQGIYKKCDNIQKKAEL